MLERKLTPTSASCKKRVCHKTVTSREALERFAFNLTQKERPNDQSETQEIRNGIKGMNPEARPQGFLE
jgi:hypothetical protein